MCRSIDKQKIMELKKLETRQEWILRADGHSYVRTIIDWHDNTDVSIGWRLNEDQKDGVNYLNYDELEEIFRINNVDSNGGRYYPDGYYIKPTKDDGEEPLIHKKILDSFKEVSTFKSEQLLAFLEKVKNNPYSNSCLIEELIKDIIIPTVGSEPDITFWEEVIKKVEDSVLKGYAKKQDIQVNSSNGGEQSLTFQRLSQLEHDSEEYHCVQSVLDDLGIPSVDNDGELSAVGRIKLLLQNLLKRCEIYYKPGTISSEHLPDNIGDMEFIGSGEKNINNTLMGFAMYSTKIKYDEIEIILPTNFMNCAVTVNNNFTSNTNDSYNWGELSFPLPKPKYGWMIKKYKKHYNVDDTNKVVVLIDKPNI